MKRITQNIADYIRETDKLLLLFCFAASLFGCALVYSATNYTGSSRQFFVQLASVFIGITAAIIVSLFDYRSFSRYTVPIVIISLGLLAFTYFFGYAPSGTDNRAWIQLPFGMSFQPSELIKVFFTITFSAHVASIDKKDINNIGHVALLCLHGIAPAALVMGLQRDLGTSTILLVIFLCMLFAAGIKLRYFALGGAALVVLVPIIWLYGLSDYQKERFSIILDLNSDPLGDGYQQLQSLKAIGSGGINGLGFLNGPKTQSGDVPKAYNDFILSVAGEELGLIGCLLVFIILLAIILRVLRVGTLTKDRKGAIVCAGIFGMLLSQMLINVGMCVALLPVIGVTLPFFSAGGTSLVCLYLGIGLVLSVYKNRSKYQTQLRQK